MDWSTAGAIAPENKHEAHVVIHFLKYQNWMSPKRYFRFFFGLAESSRRRWRERERGLVYEGLVIYPLVSTSQGPLACFFLGCGLPSFNCNPELPSPSFFGRTEVDPLLQL